MRKTWNTASAFIIGAYIGAQAIWPLADEYLHPHLPVSRMEEVVNTADEMPPCDWAMPPALDDIASNATTTDPVDYL